MNYLGSATHLIELLGMPFLVEVFHIRSSDRTNVYANPKGPNGYIKGTTVQDPFSGKSVVIEVAPAITELRAFVWKLANKAVWDSIYIPGEYAERKDDKTGEVISKARSKNVLQEKIMSAKNWPPPGLEGLSMD